MATEAHRGLLKLQKLSSQVELSLGIAPVANYLGYEHDTRPKTNYTNAEVIDAAAYVARAGEQSERFDIKESALQLRSEFKEKVSEKDCLERMRDYESAIIGCTSLGALAERLCSMVESQNADSIKKLCNTFNSALNKVWSNLRSRGHSICSRIRDLMGKVEIVLSHGFDKVQHWLNQVIESVFELIRLVVGGFLEFANEIANIAREKQFTLTEISVKFTPIKVKLVEVGGLPILLPRFEAPEVTYKFTPTTNLSSS